MLAGDNFESVFQEWASIFMHRSMRGHVRYMRENGLSRSMLATLYFLNHRGNTGVSDLGDHLGVSNAAASQMVEKLVAEGLIERVEDPDDRRMKKITMTSKGLKVMKESVDARLGWIEELMNDLTPDEKSQITDANQLLIDKVRELYPCPEENKHHNRSNT
jgi:DNA-binding MarR family transcriptional regulator